MLVTEISKIFFLQTAIDQAFDLLSNAETITKWSGQDAKIQLIPSGTVELFDQWMHGSILEVVRPIRLSYTWKVLDWNESAEPSTVKFTLTRQKGRTKVLVEHSGFPSEAEARAHEEGWKTNFFDLINNYLNQK